MSLFLWPPGPAILAGLMDWAIAFSIMLYLPLPLSLSLTLYFLGGKKNNGDSSWSVPAGRSHRQEGSCYTSISMVGAGKQHHRQRHQKMREEWTICSSHGEWGNNGKGQLLAWSISWDHQSITCTTGDYIDFLIAKSLNSSNRNWKFSKAKKV